MTVRVLDSSFFRAFGTRAFVPTLAEVGQVDRGGYTGYYFLSRTKRTTGSTHA